MQIHPPFSLAPVINSRTLNWTKNKITLYRLLLLFRYTCDRLVLVDRQITFLVQPWYRGAFFSPFPNIVSACKNEYSRNNGRMKCNTGLSAGFPRRMAYVSRFSPVLITVLCYTEEAYYYYIFILLNILYLLFSVLQVRQTYCAYEMQRVWRTAN